MNELTNEIICLKDNIDSLNNHKINLSNEINNLLLDNQKIQNDKLSIETELHVINVDNKNLLTEISNKNDYENDINKLSIENND